jgi:hypothetical protein
MGWIAPKRHPQLLLIPTLLAFDTTRSLPDLDFAVKAGEDAGGGRDFGKMYRILFQTASERAR